MSHEQGRIGGNHIDTYGSSLNMEVALEVEEKVVVNFA